MTIVYANALLMFEMCSFLEPMIPQNSFDTLTNDRQFLVTVLPMSAICPAQQILSNSFISSHGINRWYFFNQCYLKFTSGEWTIIIKNKLISKLRVSSWEMRNVGLTAGLRKENTTSFHFVILNFLHNSLPSTGNIHLPITVSLRTWNCSFYAEVNAVLVNVLANCWAQNFTLRTQVGTESCN